jgi:hypothetical protein
MICADSLFARPSVHPSVRPRRHSCAGHDREMLPFSRSARLHGKLLAARVITMMTAGRRASARQAALIKSGDHVRGDRAGCRRTSGRTASSKQDVADQATGGCRAIDGWSTQRIWRVLRFVKAFVPFNDRRRRSAIPEVVVDSLTFAKQQNNVDRSSTRR